MTYKATVFPVKNFGYNLNLPINKDLKIQRMESAAGVCQHLIQGFCQSWMKKRNSTSVYV